MQGNRAIQKSGHVDVFCFFCLLGRWGVTFCPTVPIHVPFRFTPSTHLSSPPFLKLSFPHHNSVSTVPRNLVPSCVFAHLPNLCVVCHSVNVYPILSHFCISRFSPRLSAVDSTARLNKHPLSFSVGLLFHERSGRSHLTHLTSFSIGQHIRHGRVPFV